MGVKQLLSKLEKETHDKELEKLLEKVKTRIKVVGTGGAGGNTLTRLMQIGIEGAETIAINTDAQDLLCTISHKKILIGRNLTGGLGAGADPRLGAEAAKENRDDIKKALEGADMVFLTCGLGGGCLRGSSLIYTNPDGPVRIDSIKPGSFVYSLEEGRLVKKKVLAAMKTGVKRTFEIKTRNHTLYASYDHPFLKVVPLKKDKRGRFHKFALQWVAAESLRAGDLVVVLRKTPEDLSDLRGNHITKNFCRVFGFLLGDGWISRSKESWKIYFSPSAKEEVNTRYVKLMQEVFGLRMKRSKNWYYANSKKVYLLLERLGLKKTAKEKEIPSWVFGLPDSFKRAFILGLADADGHYYQEKKKLELRFEMRSEKLIRQLKVLCNYLGLRTSNIGCRKRELKPPNSKQKIKATFWNLRVYKLFQLDEKLEKFRKRKGMGFLYGYRGPTSSEFFKYFGFNRIESVREVGEEEVYDITVEGSHNFVAEGFVVHNTGSGSIPIIAELAKKVRALSVAVVTLPFSVEGRERMQNAMQALERLESVVDTLIVIPNDKLLEIVPDVSLVTAFKICDEILANSVKGIAELVTKPGLVNLDFADVRAVMGNGGLAMIGLGESDSENRAFESVEKALNNPLLSVKVEGAKSALVNISGGPDLTMKEAEEVAAAVSTKLAKDAKFIWGSTIDKSLSGKIRTLVILTGVESPQIFGPGKPWSKQRRKEIEQTLGIEFIE